jgi:hypothetical protein
VGAFASAGFLVLPPIPKYMVNMGVTVGIGVTVVFLAWTSSKELHVLKVMKMIVKTLYRTRTMRKILTKILGRNIYKTVLLGSRDD